MQRLLAFLLLWCGVSCCVGQAPAAGANWDHLKALPVQTKLHVASDKGSKTCRLMSVSDDALVCGKTTFARGDVKSVKLTRYGVSTAAGIGIGAGVGLAVGFGVTQSPGRLVQWRYSRGVRGAGGDRRRAGDGAGRCVSWAYGVSA